MLNIVKLFVTENEEQLLSAYDGVKMRGSMQSKPLISPSTEEDDLKWVEENIANASLPILDSDEELEISKFEVSKML